MVDRVFDFLNFRNPFGEEFKKPLNRDNLEQVKNVVDYLSSLTAIKRTLIYSTPRKTFVINEQK